MRKQEAVTRERILEVLLETLWLILREIPDPRASEALPHLEVLDTIPRKACHTDGGNRQHSKTMPK